jgi:hypothetical protein
MRKAAMPESVAISPRCLRSLFRRFSKSWDDDSYDADVMLCLTHAIWLWVIVIDHSIRVADAPSITMLRHHEQTIGFVVVAMILAMAHFANIIVRKPVLRIPAYTASLLWGVFVVAVMLFEFGINMESAMYATWLVYLPARKISFILRSNMALYRAELLVWEDSKDVTGKSGDQNGEQQ